MKKSEKSTSGRKGHFGVMAISAAPLEMQAKKPSASLSKVKGEARRSSTRLKTSRFSRRAYKKLDMPEKCITFLELLQLSFPVCQAGLCSSWLTQ
jgi:hypothetical protein